LNKFKTLAKILQDTVDKRISFGLLYNQDVTPNFVAKSHFVLRLHSEMDLKLSKTLWSFHFHFPNIVRTRLDLISGFDCFRFQIVTACLNKVKISWPSCLSVVSDCPFLDKLLARINLILVSKTFLDKTTFVPNFFFLVVFCDILMP